MRVDQRDERCVIITIDPVTRERDPPVLRTLAEQRDVCIGVYGSTVQPGPVALGDAVLLEHSHRNLRSFVAPQGPSRAGVCTTPRDKSASLSGGRSAARGDTDVRSTASSSTRRSRDRVATIVARHGELLTRVARSYSLCADDAQDAVQRALEIYMRRVESLDPATELAWLKVVVKHESLAVRRARAGVRARRSTSTRSPRWRRGRSRSGAESAERVERSAEVMRRLKRDEARALMLKAQGLSYVEIGERLGWTYTKVNRCITEGRRRFMQLYEELETGAECERLAPSRSRWRPGPRRARCCSSSARTCGTARRAARRSATSTRPACGTHGLAAAGRADRAGTSVRRAPPRCRGGGRRGRPPPDGALGAARRGVPPDERGRVGGPARGTVRRRGSRATVGRPGAPARLGRGGAPAPAELGPRARAARGDDQRRRPDRRARGPDRDLRLGRGAGTYCVATALLPDPKPAIHAAAKPSAKRKNSTHTERGRTSQRRRPIATSTPVPAATSTPRPSPAKRRRSGNAQTPKAEQTDEFSFESGTGATSTSATTASSGATNAPSSADGSFESGATTATGGESNDGGGGEFSP